MSTESTARTPLPYRLVRPWVSTIVVFCMWFKVGFVERHVVGREIDFSGHPRGGANEPRVRQVLDRPERLAGRQPVHPDCPADRSGGDASRDSDPDGSARGDAIRARD